MVEWAAANVAEGSNFIDDNIDSSGRDYGNERYNRRGAGEQMKMDRRSEKEPQDLGQKHGQGQEKRSVKNQQHGTRKKPSETPEAALARLTSSYSTAMRDVGSLHKANAKLVKALKKLRKTSASASGSDEIDANKPTPTPMNKVTTESEVLIDPKVESAMEMFKSLQKLSNQARDTFEASLSTDFSSFAPTFVNIYHNHPKRLAVVDMSLIPSSSACAALTSGAHSGTVKELTYATLVNYADLLMCGCTLRENGDTEMKKLGNEQDILDRGAVDVLKSLTCHDPTGKLPENRCLWSDFESITRTRRLALVAYCDATDIEGGTDPTIWFKLACAARALGKALREKEKKSQKDGKGEMDVNMDTGSEDDKNLDAKMEDNDRRAGEMINLSYERLERYALERGLCVLKPGVPPNRVNIRAFREFEANKAFTTEIGSYLPQEGEVDVGVDTADLIIDLPRYSWSTLGRYLLRACRDGVNLQNEQTGMKLIQSWKSPSFLQGNDFASPCIQVKISPLLTIPKEALVKVCEFGGPEAVKRLESTCRSFSVDIISARALIEKNQNDRMKQIEVEMGDMLEKETEDEQNEKQEQQLMMRFAHRSSKRVRSQLITSGKQAERSAKRKSVEYCLVSSIIPCTIDHPDYSSLLNRSLNWDSLEHLNRFAENTKELVGALLYKRPEDERPVLDTAPSADRTSGKRGAENVASLNAFIKRWSLSNSGAKDMMYRFLAHVSCFVDEIYRSETGTMMLSQCISECFDILLSNDERKDSMCPGWFGLEEFIPEENSIHLAIETFAINLFVAELKMRACERHVVITSFNDEFQIVRTNLPHLLHYAEALGRSTMNGNLQQILAKLQTRTYWLAGVFYGWLGRRHTSHVVDVKEIESLAIEFVDKAIVSLKLPEQNPILVISTAHLASPGRAGNHWLELSHENLKSYRDEIELNTVISRVRQKFCDLVLELKSPEELLSGKLTETADSALLSIRSDLFERYGLGSENCGQNFDELITDFVDRCGSNLMLGSGRSSSDSISEVWEPIWNVFPTNACSLGHLESPSLLTIVVICHHYKSSNLSRSLLAFIPRLIIAALGMRSRIIEQKESNIDLALDDDGSISSNESSIGHHSDACDPATLMQLNRYLLAKLRVVLDESQNLQNEEINIICAVKVSIEASAGILLGSKIGQKESLQLQPDVSVFSEALSIAAIYLHKVENNSTQQKNVEASILLILWRILVHGKRTMIQLLRGEGRIGRALCHQLVILRAKYLAAVATEVGGFFSKYRNIYVDGNILESDIIRRAINISEDEKIGCEIAPLAQLAESLCWLWEFVSGAEKVETSTPSVYSSITNSVHKHAAKELLVPIAGAIVGLCGSAGYSPRSSVSEAFFCLEKKRIQERKEAISLSDNFGTGDSAKEWMSGDEYDNDDVKTRRSLMQTLNRTVQCIGLVFSGYSDEDISADLQCIMCPFSEGYFLPLYVIRVLSNICDFVLVEYCQKEAEESGKKHIWDDEYPYGFRGAGAQLDLLLHRAYRCLHGIHISSPHLQNLADKDAAIPLTSNSQTENKKYFLPESANAAVQLYRCVKRAYSHGRRNIPPTLFACITSALPIEVDSDKVKAIKKFIFSSNQDKMCMAVDSETAETLISTNEVIDTLPPDFPVWLFSEAEEDVDDVDESSSSLNEEDISLVRRGISEYLAQAPLPTNPSDAESYAAGLQERKSAAEVESACSKKISAVIKALHYSPNDEEKWYQAGMCLGIRLDLILDRIIPGECRYKYHQFYLPSFSNFSDRNEYWKHERGQCLNLSALSKKQRQLYVKKLRRQMSLEGTNLSSCMKYQWCKRESLKAFEDEILKSCDVNNTTRSALKDKARLLSIRSAYDKGNYQQWQSQWGIVLTSALSVMRHKCFRIAMFLSKAKEEAEGDSIYSAVAEATGTAYYNAIGLSAMRMSKFEKRRKAQLAQACFQAAYRSLQAALKPDSDNVLATWELNFMIGKCNEKIASSVDQEIFKKDSNSRRCYEILMNKALESYTSSLRDAKAFADEGNSLDFQGGGSSHGLVEMVYRIHATRLKLLLFAVKTSQNERDSTILEALRLAERFWFDESKNEVIEEAYEESKDGLIEEPIDEESLKRAVEEPTNEARKNEPVNDEPNKGESQKHATENLSNDAFIKNESMDHESNDEKSKKDVTNEQSSGNEPMTPANEDSQKEADEEVPNEGSKNEPMETDDESQEVVLEEHTNDEAKYKECTDEESQEEMAAESMKGEQTDEESQEEMEDSKNVMIEEEDSDDESQKEMAEDSKHENIEQVSDDESQEEVAEVYTNDKTNDAVIEEEDSNEESQEDMVEDSKDVAIEEEHSDEESQEEILEEAKNEETNNVAIEEKDSDDESQEEMMEESKIGVMEQEHSDEESQEELVYESKNELMDHEHSDEESQEEMVDEAKNGLMENKHALNEESQEDFEVQATDERPVRKSKDNSIDERLWNVLCDIVEGLAYCRKEQPYFHRSIYRHAQALLWAPILYNSKGALEGSRGIIPVQKGSQLPGLNSGNCAECAGPVISTLFSKKRAQLCAVWVTTPVSPTPFEVINSSGRKYNRLRCKYIGAFIECMRLCEKSDQLKTFLKSCNASSRDLPSFYDVTVSKSERLPPRLHSKDNLLHPNVGVVFFAKKYANSTLSLILLDLLSKNGNENKRAVANKIFDGMYKCFLRLNCPVTNNLWLSQKSRQLFENGLIAEADALCKAYQHLYAGEHENTSRLSFSQMSWEQKISSLRSAVQEGSNISVTIDNGNDTVRSNRRKRKASPVEDLLILKKKKTRGSIEKYN